MSSKEFSQFANNITIQCKCPHCNHIFTTEPLDVPTPDWSSESQAGSIESEIYDITCEKCENQFSITVSNGICGGEAYADSEETIMGIDEDISQIDEFFEELDQVSLEETHDEIEKALDTIKYFNDDIKQYFYRLLYANAITAMESYLCETLKREVLKNELNVRKFAETYEPFKNVTILLCNVFKQEEKLPTIITKELKELMYHNLGKIKQIFLKALNIDFGCIEYLCKAVNIRHDLVHRNGKNFEGVEHIITESNVREVNSKVKELVNIIENQLGQQRINELNDSIETEESNAPSKE